MIFDSFIFHKPFGFPDRDVPIQYISIWKFRFIWQMSEQTQQIVLGLDLVGFADFNNALHRNTGLSLF